MAITKSAKKALRKSLTRREKNFSNRKHLKNLLKEMRTLVSEKKIEEAKKLLPKAYKTLDKAAKKGLIKKNTASRKKSRITKLVKSSGLKS